MYMYMYIYLRCSEPVELRVHVVIDSHLDFMR